MQQVILNVPNHKLDFLLRVLHEFSFVEVVNQSGLDFSLAAMEGEVFSDRDFQDMVQLAEKSKVYTETEILEKYSL